MIKPYDMARWYGFFIPRQARPILQLFAFLDFSSDFLTDFGFFWSDFLTDFILLSVGALRAPPSRARVLSTALVQTEFWVGQG